MKANSKTLLNLVTVLALSITFVPAVSLAHGGDDSAARPSVSPRVHEAGESESPEPSESPRSGRFEFKGDNRNFCSRFNTSTTKLTGDFDNRVNKFNADQATDTQKRDDAEKTATAKIADLRAKADDLRQQHISKLESDAATDAQKQVVTDFQTAVSAAVTARRAAVDKARDDFKAGVAAAVAGRQTQIKQALAAYHSSVTAALTQAKSSCAAGVNPQTITQTLKTQLEAARTTLKSSLQGASKVGSQVKQLAATRNAAVQAANTAFKQAIQAAAAKLKAALGQTGQESPEPSESLSPSPSATP
jgi:hypothetical protein